MAITDDFPTGHATLSDGSTTIPFIFTDGNGKKNQRAFTASPYPRTALKTTTGESKYSDLEPPYFAIPQDDWTGGRGNEDFEGDTSRYFDGNHVDTTKESGVVLTGRETFSTGYRNVDQEMPGSVEWKGLVGSARYRARKFSATVSYTTYRCEVWLKIIGSPGDVTVSIWDANLSGERASVTLSASGLSTDVSRLRAFVWTGTPAIESGTDYYVAVYGAVTDDEDDHWEVGCAEVAGKNSTAGSVWFTSTFSPYFRITSNVGDFTAKFFEYKRGLYMVTQPNTGGNSALYINGDRGAADDNSGNKARLNDATKTGGTAWTADEWIGSVVLITKGPGSDETQNWRTITDNGTNWLESAAWNVTHTTATEYVILGSDKWTNLSITFSSFVTDVAVTGEFIYFAKGPVSLHRVRFYTNSSGVWSTYASSDTPHADSLLSIYSSDSGSTLYGAENDDDVFGVNVWKAKPHYGDYALYYDLGEFVETDKPWDSIDVDNVTQATTATHTSIAVASGHSTGIVAVKNLPTPLDITHANFISMWIKTTATSVDDLKFLYDDVEDLGKTWSPAKVFLADYGYDRQPTKIYLLDEEGDSPTYTDQPNAYDCIANTIETVTIETDDRYLIGYSAPFNKIYFDLGVVNDVVADIDVLHFNGKTAVSFANISDGTETGSDTSLGQDGTISWTLPDEWVPQTINEVEAYWVHLTWTATLKTGVTIKRVYVTVDEKGGMEPLYDNLTNVYDGSTVTSELLKVGTEDYIYIGYSRRFNKITVDVGTVNDIASVLTAQYFNGRAWTSVAIVDGTNPSSPSDGDTLKEDGDITFTIPVDWRANTVNGTETYWIRLDVSVALSVAFSINEISVTRQNYVSLSIPTIVANVWKWVSIAFSSPTTYPIPDSSRVKSVGIQLNTDDGAQTISIHDVRIGVGPPDDYADGITRLPSSHRINGMEAYSGNVDDPVENPWIFTEKGVYELQTQNNDQIVAIPLKELASLQSSENGLGHTVNSTYLYFNVGEKIERYFNRTLDDIGPDRDVGLPSGRQGIPKSLASYPGRVFAGIDADSGSSSALALDGSAWSEVYRARSSNRIRSIYTQSIPGTNVDKLWISQGGDVVSLPISLNPYNDTDFTYNHEGSLVTSWIYAGLLDVVKKWKSLKIFAEDVNSNRYIVADYRVDTDLSWTEIGTFNTAPVQERDIASTFPRAKRIKFRFRFHTNDNSETPRLKAFVVEGVAFVPTKTSYSWTFAIKKTTENIDLKGAWNDSLTSVAQYDKLLSWANAGTQLTLSHHSTLYEGKTVYIDPVSVSPIEVVDNIKKENHVAQLTCFEF